MVACERMPVDCRNVLVGGDEWTPRGASVGARERLPVGFEDVCIISSGERPQEAVGVDPEWCARQRQQGGACCRDERARGSG